MSEKLSLSFGNGSSYELTPENTTLYTFLGKTALETVEIENSVVNHVFVQTSPDEETASGMYFFKEFDQDRYDTITRHMVEHSWPMLLNLRVVPECDLRVWKAKSDAEVNEFATKIPDAL